MSSFLLNLAASALFLAGLVMVYSTTSAEVLDHDLQISLVHVLMKQILYGVCGLLLAIVCYRTGFHKLLEISPLLLGLFTFFLLLVLVPGIGKEVNGSRRWLMFAGISLQPSEFVKYIIPLYLIHRFQRFKDETVWNWRTLFALARWVLIPLGLILIEPNNGTVGVIILTVLALFWLVRVPAKLWAMPLALAVVVLGTFASQLPYVSGRIHVYLNPELDLLGRGHQPFQAKVAAGSGRLLGRGPGNSLQKMSYLPEAQNDYIAAIYAEEYGFIGMLFLVSIYILIAMLGFTVAYECRDLQAGQMAGIITFLITFQAFVNLGVVSGLLPSTGLNLPLFSQGGSSLIANIGAIGLLTRIALSSHQPAMKTIR